MRKLYNIIIGVLFFPPFLISIESMGAEQIVKGQLDSTIVDSGDGELTIKYSVKPFDFGPLPHPESSQRHSLTFSEAEKALHFENSRASLESAVSVRKFPRRISTQADYSDYAVGEIPLEEGISPSGARTYQIPITTATGFKLAPSIALGYSSQAGNGWAGYGWDIQGLSTISLINKNVYYHGTAKGASVEDMDAAFSLDGIPLVRNVNSSTSSAYPLETATGHILVAPEKNSQGYVTRFTALYPNGLTAVFGIESDGAYHSSSYPVTEMRDIEGNKITFNYAWDINGDNYRISSIYYGYDHAGQYLGEIEFEYFYCMNYPTQYYAGTQCIAHIG